MAIKRIITEEQKSKIVEQKKYKAKVIAELTQEEKDELLGIIARKLNLM